MRLDNNKEFFIQLIKIISEYYKIDSAQVEKDYYVTLLLKEIAKRIPNIIFKGGTSLSKCHKIIHRFSEDIDLTLQEDFQTQGQKRKFKKEIINACDSLNLKLLNYEEIRSRRDYNCYKIQYPINYQSQTFKPLLLVETTYITSSYPSEIQPVTSIIYDYLLDSDNLDLILEYELEPFNIRVQSLERTFIDKVFAICDYAISNRIDRNSRHIYDLSRLLIKVNLNDDLKKLVKEVREERKKHNTCYSARNNININEILKSIIDSNLYKNDYNKITKNMMYKDLSYEEAVNALNIIIFSNVFEN